MCMGRVCKCFLKWGISIWIIRIDNVLYMYFNFKFNCMLNLSEREFKKVLVKELICLFIVFFIIYYSVVLGEFRGI